MMKALVLILSISLCSHISLAETKKTKKSLRTTEAHFSGATVRGKYVHSPEAKVLVEKEKKLISVVKPRENFNLQIKKSQEDYK